MTTATAPNSTWSSLMPDRPDAMPRVALLGNPNTGKTTIFNALSGLRHKTSNFPGTTQEARIGTLQGAAREVEIIDLPGAYSLELPQSESRVCLRGLARSVRGQCLGPRRTPPGVRDRFQHGLVAHVVAPGLGHDRHRRDEHLARRKARHHADRELPIKPQRRKQRLHRLTHPPGVTPLQRVRGLHALGLREQPIARLGRGRRLGLRTQLLRPRGGLDVRIAAHPPQHDADRQDVRPRVLQKDPPAVDRR